MLVSFDVVSLFTKIPVDLAIKVATNRLRYDDSLWQKTSFPLEDITDLLSFCTWIELESRNACDFTATSRVFFVHQ